MDFYDVIKKRKSVRNYLPREVEDDKIERILNAGRLAPSGKNAQAWKFIITRKKEIKEALVDACKGQKFIAQADCILTVCVNEEEVFQHHGNYMTCFSVDGAIALDHMILAATVEGLGTCWIGAFLEEKVREVLNVPQPYRIVGLTPIGYPRDDGKSRGRKEMEKIVIWDKWS